MARKTALFIGNSFTQRNDVPGMVEQLAKAAKHELDAKLISRGGASLRMHWNKGAALAEIRGGEYDFVVLQEQSTLPVKNAGRMRDNVRDFDAEIKAAKSKTVLYMTWARAHAPDTQQQITDAYNSIGKELGALVIPTGVAWQNVLARKSHPVLHDKDGSHPTLAGSYLAACCTFAVLFDESPVGLPAPSGLSEDDAAILQRDAADAITR
jgi:hypothetical protein